MQRGPRLRIYGITLLIIILLLVSGCWDSHELNKISLLIAAGWDLDPGTGEITITYQSIVPSQVKSSSGSDGNDKQKGSEGLQTVQFDQSTGVSPFDVLNRLTQHASRIPFYHHTLITVFGKDSAQQGINPFLGIIVNGPPTRPSMLIAISEGKASDILEFQAGMESIQGSGMDAEIKLSEEFSRYPAVSTLDFANRMMSETTAPIAPILGILEETGPEGKKQKKIRITGTAVFRKGKIIGVLNERESSGLLWAINKIRKGYVIIPEADIAIDHAQCKIDPELTEGKIKITIEIKEESNLSDYKGHQEISPDILQQLEKRQAQEIESQVMAAVQKSFLLNADVFGFGDAVHRKYKKEWQDLKPQWHDIYPDIKVVVKVKTHINEIGDTNNAIMKD